ncbi:MAG: hypothetical protein Q9184_006737 [Pyrenodesmia sp. 2 TL-2023]
MASELVFINLSGPEDSKSDDKRRAVRSQAAKDHSQSSSTQQSTRRRRRKLLSVELEVDVSESSSSDGSPPVEESPTDPGARSNLTRIEGKAKEDHFDRRIGEVARVGFKNTWTHPFVPYPDKTFVPAILSTSGRVDLSTMAVDIPELDQPGPEGALRSIWFPMVIADQAMLNVVILTAASNYISVHQTQCSPEVLWKVKEDALASVNRGIRDPQLATSDQMIGAVAKMAAYEAGFAGDEKQYRIHMSGLTKMVELRGGLGSLGLNGLLARMLLWVDLNAAFILNTKTYFLHPTALPGHTGENPNPSHSLGES